MYRTKEIILKPLTIDYVNKTYLSWFNDIEVTQYTSHSQFPKTIQDLRNYVNDIDFNRITFAILAKELPGQFTTNREADFIHIGNISLQEIDYINRSAEIAFLIGDKDYWGKGIATMAGKFLLSHGFDKLNLNRIWLGAAERNEGMIKVAGKLAMKLEGRFKEGLYIDGKYQSILRYGILKREWDEIIENMGKNVK